MASTSTPPHSTDLNNALLGISPEFRKRLLKAYGDLRRAIGQRQYDTCGLRVGRFCEVLLRWLQQALTGTCTPFGTRIRNFKNEVDSIERLPATTGNESLRILIPRALAFAYTLRNKRGIGHEGGDVDANVVDALTMTKVADWCVAELVRIYHHVSLEEAQAICDTLATREVPLVAEALGKRRVLNPDLSYSEQTLILLYAAAETAVPAEDLQHWTDHPSLSLYRRDVLRRLHKARLVEFDDELDMVALLPPGIARVESDLLDRTS